MVRFQRCYSCVREMCLTHLSRLAVGLFNQKWHKNAITFSICALYLSVLEIEHVRAFKTLQLVLKLASLSDRYVLNHSPWPNRSTSIFLSISLPKRSKATMPFAVSSASGSNKGAVWVHQRILCLAMRVYSYQIRSGRHHC